MKFSGTVGAWQLSMTHDDVGHVSDVAYLAAASIPPPVDGYVAAAAAYLEAVDFVGGNQGVNITGVGTVIVATPAGIPIVGILEQVVSAIGSGLASVVSGAVSILKAGLGLIHISPGAAHGELHAERGLSGQ